LSEAEGHFCCFKLL